MVEYDEQRITTQAVRRDIIGWYPIDIGLKTTICTEDSVRPQLGLVAKCTLPFFGQPDFRPQSIAPTIMLIADKMPMLVFFGMAIQQSLSAC
ncbi:MAG: hypothetical protein EAZ92_09540 [Candidatus Kapaibacterium sp.]|nr:MAG: hypothetical protein EAZ92_09540 [Candidatus Kapabacteria bacterium]